MNGEVMKNTAVGALVAAVLIAGILVAVPGGGQGPGPAPGPAARAGAAAGSGVPSSLADLNALIADRERWLRKHPRDGESWATLGSAYTERGSRLAEWAAFSKAERALRRSLEARPEAAGNTDALLGLAVLANARQDFPAALDFAERARERKPRQWTVYPALIDAYSGLGDYEATKTALETLRKLSDGSRARSVSARVYRDRGWREDAAVNASDAVAAAKARPEKAAALWRLGELAWERGEPREAAETYGEVLRLAPDHYASLVSRGRALAALGRADDALRDYQAALVRTPLPEYALEAGELYESLGLREDAAGQYERMRRSAERAAAHGVNQELVLGRYETDHGEPEAAVRRLRAEWDRGRHSVQIADALGWALFRAERPDEALPFARRATDEGPLSPLFSYHRGEIERTLGLYGPARRHVAEALRINPHFSPLLAPAARGTLKALGEPSAGGPGEGADREGGENENEDGERQKRTGAAGSDAGSGPGPGAGPGAGTGSVVGTGPGAGSGPRPDASTEAASGSGAGSGPGAEPTASTGTGSAPGADAGPSAGPRRESPSPPGAPGAGPSTPGTSAPAGAGTD
ncbi:tetratricopeptide repeat protein [Streptomyces sp. NPDC004838]